MAKQGLQGPLVVVVILKGDRWFEPEIDALPQVGEALELQDQCPKHAPGDHALREQNNRTVIQ